MTREEAIYAYEQIGDLAQAASTILNEINCFTPYDVDEMAYDLLTDSVKWMLERRWELIDQWLAEQNNPKRPDEPLEIEL